VREGSPFSVQAFAWTLAVLAAFTGVSAHAIEPPLPGNTTPPAVPAPQQVQVPMPPASAVPASKTESLLITTFQLDKFPNPIVLNSPTIGDFLIEFEYDNVARARIAISDFVSRLSFVIDNDTPRAAAASIVQSDISLPTSQTGPVAAKIQGQFALLLKQGEVGGTFFGLNWGGNHTLYLVDPASGARSNFAIIEVRSAWQYIWSMIGGVVALAGFSWWVFRWRNRGTPETSAKAVGTGTGSEAEATAAPSRVLPPPEVPRQLLTALSEGRSMLVLGGGASAQAGYPDYAELLNRLVQRLRERLPAELAQSLDAAIASRTIGSGKVMDALTAALPRDQIATEIDLILGGVKGDPDFHETLARLPWCGVVSLTWDNFAKQIFTQRRWLQNTEWQAFTPDEAAQLPSAARGGLKPFLRPLGDLSRPTTLSLSMEEYRRNLGRWPEFQRQLGLLLQTNSFLFLGVERDTLEQFLLSVGADFEVSDERHFALISDSPENALLGAKLKRFGVRLLPYTPDPDHTSVTRFVDELARSSRLRARKTSGARPAADAFATSKVSSIKLTNIGLFDEIALTFQTDPISPPETAAGGTSELARKPTMPWTVIFGPNGCGKSSILRAIGLAFCGNEATAAAARLLQVGKQEGLIEVQFGSQMLRTRLIRDRNEVIVSAGQFSLVQTGLTLVLGFPALRGAPSSNPRGVAPIEAHGPEPADLLPLINGEVDRRLSSFKQWLINVLEQAGRGDKRASAMKALLDCIIRDVVPGELQKLAPLDNSYVIRVKIDDSDKPSPTDLPFDDLSQGMTSIFNWLGVLVQRLYDFYPEVENPEAQPAVVLVDEIDAHLHPDWQRRLVELTKKFFPNVQVLATSHSPLLAGALHGKELCVLERDPVTRKVAPLPVEIDTYGMRSQFILASRIFGLSSDRNLDLEHRIKRHVELVETLEPTEKQKDELQRLTAELQGFHYAGARPSRTQDQPTPEDLDILRKRFELPSGGSGGVGSPSAGPTP